MYVSTVSVTSYEYCTCTQTHCTKRTCTSTFPVKSQTQSSSPSNTRKRRHLIYSIFNVSRWNFHKVKLPKSFVKNRKSTSKSSTAKMKLPSLRLPICIRLLIRTKIIYMLTWAVEVPNSHSFLTEKWSQPVCELRYSGFSSKARS